VTDDELLAVLPEDGSPMPIGKIRESVPTMAQAEVSHALRRLWVRGLVVIVHLEGWKRA
jgi:hypothetical protein